MSFAQRSVIAVQLAEDRPEPPPLLVGQPPEPVPLVDVSLTLVHHLLLARIVGVALDHADHLFEPFEFGKQGHHGCSALLTVQFEFMLLGQVPTLARTPCGWAAGVT